MEAKNRQALRWYLGLALLIGGCMFLLSTLPHPATVAAQTAPNIAWPQPPYPPTNVNCASATCTLIAAPSAGAVCVYSMSLTNAGSAAVTINVYQDGGTTSVASNYLAASGGNAFWPMSTNPKSPWFITNLTTALVVKVSATGQIDGSVYAQTCP